MTRTLLKNVIEVSPARVPGQQVIRCPSESIYPDGIPIGQATHFYVFIESGTRQGVMADNSGLQVFARFKPGQVMNNLPGSFPAWVRDGGDRLVRYRRVFQDLVNANGTGRPNFGSPPWGYDSISGHRGKQRAAGFDSRDHIYPMPCLGWYSFAFNFTTVVEDLSPGSDLGVVVASILLVG
jgi:hypothetical protein